MWMRTLVGCLVVFCLCSAQAGEAVPGENTAPFDWSLDLVFDSIALPQRGDMEWGFEASFAVEADLGELFGWDDFYAYIQPTLTWGAEEDYGWTLRLYQAWLSYDASDHWNLLAGLYDVGWHFHSLPSTWNFTRLPGQNSGGFSPGSLGLMDLFPLSAPGFRMEVKPDNQFYLQTSAVILESGHQIARHQLSGALSVAERTLLIAEAGWNVEATKENGYRRRKVGFGAWDIPAGELSGTSGHPFGCYAFFDLTVSTESADPEQGITAFGTASLATLRRPAVEGRLAVGAAATGLIPTRDSDETALAGIAENAGDDRRWRLSGELLHRTWIHEHAYLQGAVQWNRPDSQADREQWKLGLTVGLTF